MDKGFFYIAPAPAIFGALSRFAAQTQTGHKTLKTDRHTSLQFSLRLVVTVTVTVTVTVGAYFTYKCL
jgi:hypothetical protein